MVFSFDNAVRAAVTTEEIARSRQLSEIVDEAELITAKAARRRSDATEKLAAFFEKIVTGVCADPNIPILDQAAFTTAMSASGEGGNWGMSMEAYRQRVTRAQIYLAKAHRFLSIPGTPILAFTTSNGPEGVGLKEYAAQKAGGSGLDIRQVGVQALYHQATIPETEPSDFTQPGLIIEDMATSHLIRAMVDPDQAAEALWRPLQNRTYLVMGNEAVQSFFDQGLTEIGIRNAHTLLGAATVAGIDYPTIESTTMIR
jgi:hypothetical protein